MTIIYNNIHYGYDNRNVLKHNILVMRTQKWITELTQNMVIVEKKKKELFETSLLRLLHLHLL